MPESFILNFEYKGITREINCMLRVSAYTYQFLCMVDNQEMVLEKDDEGKMRIMEADPFSGKNQKTDPGLIRALMAELERVLH
jgi:hypothetical protein